MQIESIIDIPKFLAEIDEDQDDISEAMRKQTSRCAYYGTLHIKAKKQAATFGLAVKATEAKLTTTKRKELTDFFAEEAESAGTKPEKVTVDAVKAAVMLHPTMLGLLKQQIEVDEIEGICRVAYEAFKTRRDMLTSQGLLARESMRTGHQISAAKETARSSYHARRAERRGDAAGGDAAE